MKCQCNRCRKQPSYDDLVRAYSEIMIPAVVETINRPNAFWRHLTRRR